MKRREQKVVGLFGDPVRHSLSPVMHNTAFEALGLPYVYVPFHVEEGDLGDAVMAIRALKLVGVNVTVPHKEKVIPLLDRIDGSALRCGAVNTVVNDGGVLVGYNTDGAGFIDSVGDEGLDLRGIKAVVMGAGGAARAVIAGLLDGGVAEVVLINRTKEKAVALAASLGSNIISVFSLEDGYSRAVSGVGLVVNSLSVPFRREGRWLADLSGAAGALFYDLRYGAMPSDFLDLAKELGSPARDGLGMLLYQGVRAFYLFCGREAPVEVMRKSLEDALSV
ncbi:MAG: shikimate dehydrogenase [Dethiobacter sp.]|jgi:shikimate dehydrogenase|nr:shikimate dehydrogenase [Dethiobacter sp.]